MGGSVRVSEQHGQAASSSPFPVARMWVFSGHLYAWGLALCKDRFPDHVTWSSCPYVFRRARCEEQDVTTEKNKPSISILISSRRETAPILSSHHQQQLLVLLLVRSRGLQRQESRGLESKSKPQNESVHQKAEHGFER